MNTSIDQLISTIPTLTSDVAKTKLASVIRTEVNHLIAVHVGKSAANRELPVPNWSELDAARNESKLKGVKMYKERVNCCLMDAKHQIEKYM